MLGELLYGAGVKVMGVAMRVGANVSPKLKLGYAGREGLLERLESDFSSIAGGRPVAWFHSASLGEFEQGRPVIEAFRKEYPDYFILLTFFSPSGYEIRKNYTGADYICYLPVDTSENARRFVDAVRPQIVFFIKYEFWYHYLKALRSRHIAILSFSAIFRKEQVFFKFYGGFYRKLLSYFDHILVQNQSSLKLLKSVGIDSCSVAGDTRFDRVKSIVDSAKDLPEIAAFTAKTLCLVAGSVWQADMDVLIPALNNLKRPLRVIIAPHELKKEQMESWRKQLDGKSILYSEYVKMGGAGSFDYLIIDNVGMLSSLYRYGDLAYIGGSFGAGLHNILEAATFGLPVLFGNKSYSKFQEATDLLAFGGAVAVNGTEDLATQLGQFMENNAFRVSTGKSNADYVAAHTGATDLVMAEAKKLLTQRNMNQ